jgi:hypothetical protein
MNDDNTIKLLKDILTLHGIGGYGGDYKYHGLIERGVYYTGNPGDLNRKAANHIDCTKMNDIDDRIIELLKLYNQKKM